MRHEIFVPEALLEAAARVTKEILANGPNHAIAADTFFSNRIETNRITRPASYQRKARTIALSHLHRMALIGFVGVGCECLTGNQAKHCTDNHHFYETRLWH